MPGEDRARGIVGRRRDLGDRDLAGLLVEMDEIRKCPPGIDGDAVTSHAMIGFQPRASAVRYNTWRVAGVKGQYQGTDRVVDRNAALRALTLLRGPRGRMSMALGRAVAKGGDFGQRRFRCARAASPRQALARRLCLRGGRRRRRDHARRQHRRVAAAAPAPARAQRHHHDRHRRAPPRRPARDADHGRAVRSPQALPSRGRARHRARRGGGRRRLRPADHLHGQPRGGGDRARHRAALVPALSAARTARWRRI